MVLCFVSSLTAVNQEKLLQCLKLKIEYPNININCEELLKTNISSSEMSPEPNKKTKTQQTPTTKSNVDLENSAFMQNLPPHPTNEIAQSAQNKPNITPTNTQQNIKLKNLSSKMKENSNKIISIEKFVDAIMKSVQLVKNEFNGLKSSFNVDLNILEDLTKHSDENSYSTPMPIGNIPNSNTNKITLKKNKKQYYDGNNNNDIQAQIDMLMNKKKELKKKRLTKRNNSPNQTQLSNIEGNANKLDISLLQKNDFTTKFK